VQAQVERLIQSKTFATSEVHRRLLQYLAAKTMAGEADRLKEYTIGLEAFGKPESYDPKQDSIVRLQIGRLRQKLSSYYHEEAAGDRLVISLPKGAFKLQFADGGERPSAEAQPPGKRHWMWLLVVALAAATLWATLTTFWLHRLRARTAVAEERWNPELEALWAPFLDGNRPLLVCIGAPLFVRFPDVGFFRDPKANEWREIEKSERFVAARKALGGLDALPSYAFTGLGEAGAAVLISQLLSTRTGSVLLARSNTLSWQQIVDSNVVFIGPPKFNTQLQAAALKQDIVIEPNGLRNLKPQRGEPEFLSDHIMPGSEGETHALITRTPGLSGRGELLVIAGNASPDTQSAAEWLTEPWRARELVSHLRMPSGALPSYYQVVVRVAFKQGVPVQSSYVFHHVLKY
ncbi:MAG TPA: hypothetical protein VGH38_19945, partial [Bryobacteraceae bacterium]